MFYGYYFGIFTMLPVIILSLIVQAKLNSTYSKYSNVINSKGMTGAQMAEHILHSAGIYDVGVSCVNGHLSDHYDPTKKVVSLSADVYNGTSIAAVGIAAHECGHAIQHHEAYQPLKLRSAVIGITNLSSKILYVLMFMSIIAASSYAFSDVIFNIAILCYAVIFFFQLITLPVEFNASSRAIKQVEGYGFSGEDVSGVKKVLSSAAMTYVAAAVSALWQLLIMLNRRRR